MQELQEMQVQPLGRKIPWRKEWQPTLVFMPGESQGRRRLEGYSLWGHEEWDATEHGTQYHGERYR